MIAITTPTTNCSQPLEKMRPATTSEAITDQDRHDPPHRVAAGMEQAAERSDECSHDDEPYPVHARKITAPAGQKADFRTPLGSFERDGRLLSAATERVD